MKSSFFFLLGLAVKVFASTSSPDIEDFLPETVQMPIKEQEEEATETDLPSVSIEQATSQIVPLYQYWNPHVHDHFYTKSIQEIGVTTPGRKGHHGYIAQGVACHLLSAPCSGVVPLHRIMLEDIVLITFIQQMIMKLELLLSAEVESMAMSMKEWLDTVTKRRFQAPPLYIDSLEEEELTIFILRALYQMKLQDTIMKEFNVMFIDNWNIFFALLILYMVLNAIEIFLFT